MERGYVNLNSVKTFDGFKMVTGLPGYISVESTRSTTFILQDDETFEEIDRGWHQLRIENGVNGDIFILTIVRKR